MSFEFWLTYVVTILVLMSTPGPSQILMLTNSAHYGWRRSMLTAIGDLSANALQMLAAGLGLAVALSASPKALVAIQWLGISYLIWLGVKMMSKASPSAQREGHNGELPLLRTLWLQGFITSASNPKAVIFFAALFPQFIEPDVEFVSQFIILAFTYIVIDGCFLTAYGVGACWIVSRLVGGSKRWIPRLGAASMFFAATLLGFKAI